MKSLAEELAEKYEQVYPFTPETIIEAIDEALERAAVEAESVHGEAAICKTSNNGLYIAQRIRTLKTGGQ